MKSAIAWFAKNHVAANLLMLVIVGAGLATIPTLTQELIPDIELEYVTVSTIYPGAAPSEVEASVTNRIEEALAGQQGVKTIRSASAEGLSSVTLELMAGEDVRKRLDEVRSAIDAIDTLPDDAEQPTVKQVEIDKRVLTVAVAGQTDEWTLKHLGSAGVRDEIAALPGVSDVPRSAVHPPLRDLDRGVGGRRCVAIRAHLRRRGARQCASSSMDLPGGSVKTDAGEILLRAKWARLYRGRRLRAASRSSRARMGPASSLGDVATGGGRLRGRATRLASASTASPPSHVQVYRVGEQRDAGDRLTPGPRLASPEARDTHARGHHADRLERRVRRCCARAASTRCFATRAAASCSSC